MASALDERPSYLVLLTPAPSPATFDSLRAAYEAPLSAILIQLAEERRRAPVGSCVDVAVPIPLLASHGHLARSQLYEPIQAIVSAVYKLVCVIAAKHRINVEDAAGFDVRLVLLAGPEPAQDPSCCSSPFGSILTLQNLARSGRPWVCVFSVEGPVGEKLLHDYLRSQDGRVKIRRVRGQQTEPPNALDLPDSADQSIRHSSVIIGGTFDHIHVGHKLLLTMFAFLAEPASRGHYDITVGTTGDELLKNKKHAELLESWHDRQESVVRYLKATMDFRPANVAVIDSREFTDEGPNGHAIHYQFGSTFVLKMVEIWDPFGPTITVETLTAIVVSAETRAGGKAVNDRRREQGWAELSVFEVDVLDPTETAVSSDEAAQSSFASKLSSTAIRKKLSDQAARSGGGQRKL